MKGKSRYSENLQRAAGRGEAHRLRTVEYIPELCTELTIVIVGCNGHTLYSVRVSFHDCT
mgnify:CR=1 FL=1